MVDVNSQSKTINVNVSSSGTSSNVNASGDATLYYSNKAREWAISDRIVDGADYSSKYYANKSNQSALNAQTSATNASETYTQLQATASQALENISNTEETSIANINTVKDESLTEIETAKTTAVNTVNTTKDNAISSITTLSNDFIDEINATGDSYDNLTHRQITNCLLEVPQNIKLELTDGTLTLKAGSKVIVPNGEGVFEEVTVENDISITNGYNDKRFIFLKPNKTGLHFEQIASTQSGTSPTSSSYQYQVWYDTANNLVKSSSDSGTTWTVSGYSLPICTVTTGDGVVTSIDQIFNGMGYIGSTVWVDKGVKYLIPNGRNTDGSLNNIETNSTQVKIVTKTGTYSGVIAIGSSGKPDLYGNLILDEETNFNKTRDGATHLRLHAGTAEITNSVISNFQPKLPFRAVDYNDFNTEIDTKVSKSGDTMTGDLTIKKPDIYLNLDNTTVDNSTNSSSFQNIGTIFIRDKNNRVAGYIQNSLTAQNLLQTTIGARRNIGGADKTSSLALAVDGSGDNLFAFPQCITKPTTTSSARSNKVAVVIQNYLNGTSWYRVWSDGFIEQGGAIKSANTPISITFAKTFTDVNSIRVLFDVVNTGNTQAYCLNEIPTVSGFKIFRYGGSMTTPYANWFACGY